MKLYIEGLYDGEEFSEDEGMGMNCDGKHSGDLLRPDLGAVAAAVGVVLLQGDGGGWMGFH
jgi:hypothetical protein